MIWSILVNPPIEWISEASVEILIGQNTGKYDPCSYKKEIAEAADRIVSVYGASMSPSTYNALDQAVMGAVSRATGAGTDFDRMLREMERNQSPVIESYLLKNIGSVSTIGKNAYEGNYLNCFVEICNIISKAFDQYNDKETEHAEEYLLKMIDTTDEYARQIAENFMPSFTRDLNLPT